MNEGAGIPPGRIGKTKVQKAAQTFNPQTGRILPDLSKKAKTAMNTATETNGAKTTRTKGNNVVMSFLDEKGNPAKSPQEGCRGVHAQLIKTGNTDFLDLRAFTNEDGSPSDMLFRLAAFGASTLGRNEVNTTPEEDGPEEAEQKLLARWNGFRNNSYRSMSSGGATPVILLALERALKAAGLPEDAINTKVSTWRAKYDADGIEDEKEQGKARRKALSDLRGVAEIRAAEKQILQEREDIRAAARPAKSLGDI